MNRPLNFDELRKEIGKSQGTRQWRSWEELADTPEFRRFVEDEFPHRTPDWNSPKSRRNFLRVMGASLALAGASACTKQPKETIVPYVRQPEELVPGKAMFYATSLVLRGMATGVLVESHLGRPTKVEGNPNHPASLGATTPQMQASVLTLYDPDRSQTVRQNGSIGTWDSFLIALSNARDAAGLKKGSGLRLLTGLVTSPTFGAQLQQLFSTFPEARWHQWEPCGLDQRRAGSLAAFGQPLSPVYHFDRADRIVSLDADFLGPDFPGSLRYTHDYSMKRRAAAEDPGVEPPRLCVAESTPSITGAAAEHRYRIRAMDVEGFAEGLLQPSSDPHRAIREDLAAHRGASLIVPGLFQPARVHAIAHVLNQRLGNIGKTVTFIDPVEIEPMDQLASLTQLVADMRQGIVETLLILGGNPVYDAPADLDFLDALKKVKTRIHLGLYENETAAWCHWHVPEAHDLESWSDARAWDGTASILQPLIAPIYGSKTIHEILNVLLNRADRSPHETVQEYWKMQHPGAGFDDFWQESLYDGIVLGTAFSERTPSDVKVPGRTSAATSGLEVVIRPDPTIGDGAFSNNAWLQELPKPQNKMTWDNAVWISPRTAEANRVSNGDIAQVAVNGRSLEGPVWIMPGQADDSLTVHLGYGRTKAGRVADGVGFDAYALRTSSALWNVPNGQIQRVHGSYDFATTQITQTMEGRDPFRIQRIAEYREAPAANSAPTEPSLFPLWQYPNHKWAMSIDLTACTGCSACMVACQAENNIAVVGKDQVAMGRHMNWIRVDRYFSGSLDDPETHFQPVPCMHCENALCELVCPVAATVHSGEGLNEMVYNRCVGTRYCSNNCPYKVRRFNFFLYSDWETPSLYGLRNPDVTVRSRGVMEKCSYCVQRINRAKIDAEEQDRPLKDGEIVTACQQACPAQAIVFGDLNDPGSEVSRRKRQQRDYGLLDELNTRPRTTYLARLQNPNPELEKY